jgi:hypothetical protein
MIITQPVILHDRLRSGSSALVAALTTLVPIWHVGSGQSTMHRTAARKISTSILAHVRPHEVCTVLVRVNVIVAVRVGLGSSMD